LVQFLNRFLGSLRHLDECESPRLPGLRVSRDRGAQDSTVAGEHQPQFIRMNIERQVPDKSYFANSRTS